MLLVVAFLLPVGLVLTADRPGAAERDERAPAVRHDAPAPRESDCAVRVRLRARAPEREEDRARSRAAATAEPVAPPVLRRPGRGSSPVSELSPESLIYAYCTPRC